MIRNKKKIYDEPAPVILMLIASSTSCIVISDKHTKMQPKAVNLALDFISSCDTNNKFILCSESYEPYQFKETKYSKTLRKMSRVLAKF